MERIRQRGHSIGRLGFKMSYTRILENVKSVYDSDPDRTELEDNKYSIPSISGYGRYDWKYAGLGLGVVSLAGEYIDEDTPQFLPSIYLRLGPPKFHLTAGFLDPTIPKANPIGGHFALGFFPRSIEGSGFIIGASNFGELPAFLLSGRFYTTNGYSVQPSLFMVDGGAGVTLKIGK